MIERTAYRLNSTFSGFSRLDVVGHVYHALFLFPSANTSSCVVVEDVPAWYPATHITGWPTDMLYPASCVYGESGDPRSVRNKWWNKTEEDDSIERSIKLVAAEGAAATNQQPIFIQFKYKEEDGGVKGGGCNMTMFHHQWYSPTGGVNRKIVPYH